MQEKPYLGKPYITRGLPLPGGADGKLAVGDLRIRPVAVPIRREIRDLEKNHPDQWNLYLLALADFQATPEDEQLSYYQIAGACLPSSKELDRMPN